MPRKLTADELEAYRDLAEAARRVRELEARRRAESRKHTGRRSNREAADAR